MALSRNAKETIINEVHNGIKSAAAVIVVENKGLSVADVNALRSKIREAGATYRVTKNRLAKLALKDTIYAPVADDLTGPTALAWSEDPVAVAKCISDFAKDNEKLVILQGAFGEKPLSETEIDALAKMPSLDELRAKLISLLQTPATRIAGVVQAPGGQIARVIAAKAAKD